METKRKKPGDTYLADALRKKNYDIAKILKMFLALDMHTYPASS